MSLRNLVSGIKWSNFISYQSLSVKQCKRYFVTINNKTNIGNNNNNANHSTNLENNDNIQDNNNDDDDVDLLDEMLEDENELFESYVNPETGEIGGPKGKEPTRYGDWERAGRVSDF